MICRFRFEALPPDFFCKVFELWELSLDFVSVVWLVRLSGGVFWVQCLSSWAGVTKDLVTWLSLWIRKTQIPFGNDT